MSSLRAARGPGDVPGLLAAGGDDAVPELAGRAAGRLVPDRLGNGPPQDRRACLVICPWATVMSDSRWRGAAPPSYTGAPGMGTG